MLPCARLSVALLLGLAACSSVRETEPGRTATEQLMFSTAADRAADQLAFLLPAGARVFVDASYAEGTDSRYLLGAIRDRILLKGASLVNERGEAGIVIEPRIGAMSIDRNKTLYGTPDFGIPLPLTGDLRIPELALFKRDARQAVIKVAATGYDAKTGTLIQSIDPVYGFAYKTDWVALLFISWSRNDLVPEPIKREWIGE